MPTGPLPDALRALLAKPNPAVIATVRPDGQPVSVATWYLLDGDRVLVNMDEGRARLDHLRHDPRVSLTALDEDGWYTHVSLVGRVVEMSKDASLLVVGSRGRTGVASIIGSVSRDVLERAHCTVLVVRP